MAAVFPENWLIAAVFRKKNCLVTAVLLENWLTAADVSGKLLMMLEVSEKTGS